MEDQLARKILLAAADTPAVVDDLYLAMEVTVGKRNI